MILIVAFNMLMYPCLITPVVVGSMTLVVVPIGLVEIGHINVIFGHFTQVFVEVGMVATATKLTHALLLFLIDALP
jgi:hypothetical protein